jgi:hypothetical protein
VLAPALRALRVEMMVQTRHYMCVVSATDSIPAGIGRVRTMFFVSWLDRPIMLVLVVHIYLHTC